MRKLISILLIISCVTVLAACSVKLGNDSPEGTAGENNDTSVTATPTPNGQGEGTVDDGNTSVESTPDQGTITYVPTVTTEPGIDLEEDILTDSDSAVTNTPKPTATTVTATQTTSSMQATPTPVAPTVTAAPSEAPTPTATAPTAQATESPIIKLPFDAF